MKRAFLLLGALTLVACGSDKTDNDPNGGDKPGDTGKLDGGRDTDEDVDEVDVVRGDAGKTPSKSDAGRTTGDAGTGRNIDAGVPSKPTVTGTTRDANPSGNTANPGRPTTGGAAPNPITPAAPTGGGEMPPAMVTPDAPVVETPPAAVPVPSAPPVVISPADVQLESRVLDKLVSCTFLRAGAQVPAVLRIRDTTSRCAANCVTAAQCDDIAPLACERSLPTGTLLSCLFNNCTAPSNDGFACGDGGHTPYLTVCDGTANCPNGSDEQNCVHTCRDGQQVQAAGVTCNGTRDCNDGSDEADCPSCG